MKYTASVPVGKWLGIAYGEGMTGTDIVRFAASNDSDPIGFIGDYWATDWAEVELDW